MTYRIVRSTSYRPADLALARPYADLADAVADMGEGIVLAEDGHVTAFHEKHLRFIEFREGRLMPEPEHLTVEPRKRGTVVRDREGDTWRRGTTRWNCEAPVDGDRVTRAGRLPWYALVDQYGPLTLVSEPAPPLSASQARMLRHVRDYGEVAPFGSGGMANAGGLEQTRMALMRKGLIRYDRDGEQGAWVLTDAGRRAVGDA